VSVPKRCEVCGGNVRPTDEPSKFGYCEKCGIVYVLRAAVREEWGEGAPGPSKGDSAREAGSSETAVPPDEVPPRASVFRWRCPDCNEDLRADSDTDLEFLKREHIREYHPNR
jgi:predicted RNA-binding Zn-ribbon protein involved in translation (DUF1610 family)